MCRAEKTNLLFVLFGTPSAIKMEIHYRMNALVFQVTVGQYRHRNDSQKDSCAYCRKRRKERETHARIKLQRRR